MTIWFAPRHLAYFVLLLPLGGCLHSLERTPPAEPTQQALIRAFVDAYNRCDLEAAIALTHAEVTWFAVEGDQTSVMTSGKAALRKELEGYMAPGCAVTSELSDWSINGAFVAVTETAHWRSRSGDPQQQSATAVYEIDDHAIRRVWYFPARKGL